MVAKGNILKYMSSFFDNICTAFDEEKLGAELTINFLNSIPGDYLTDLRLNTMDQIVKGTSFMIDGSRKILIPYIIEKIEFYFGKNRDLCINIINSMIINLDNLKKKRTNISAVGKKKKYLTDRNVIDSIYQLFLLLPILKEDLKENVDKLDEMNRKKEEKKKKKTTSQKKVEVESAVEDTENKESRDKKNLKIKKSAPYKIFEVICIFMGILNLFKKSDGIFEIILELEIENVLLLNEKKEKEEEEKNTKEQEKIEKFIENIVEKNEGVMEKKDVIDIKRQSLMKIIKDIFYLFENVLKNENIVPKNWIYFKFYLFKCCQWFFKSISFFFIKKFMDSKNQDEKLDFFDYATLWENLFDDIFDFIFLDSLQIENIPPYLKFQFIKYLKRKFSKKKKTNLNQSQSIIYETSEEEIGYVESKDFRTKCFIIFFKLWKSLGENQAYFVPNIIHKILKIFKINIEKSRNLSIETYVSVIEREFLKKKTVENSENVTQRVVVLSLNEIEHNLFVKRIQDKFKHHSNSEIKKIGLEMVDRLNNLLQFVGDISSNALNNDEKIETCHEVMNYFSQTNNDALYFTYVHILSDLHLKLKNYAESGLALLLHANKLGWNRTRLLEHFNDKYKEETEARRKERLIKSAVSYFVIGKDFERAIEYSEELKNYFLKTYQYLKLNKVLNDLAKYYSNIVTTKRFFSNYYYVRFIGYGFEIDKENRKKNAKKNQTKESDFFTKEREKKKENQDVILKKKVCDISYIYNAGESMRITEFTEKLKKEYDAKILNKSPDKNFNFETEEKFIEVCTVSPSNEGEVQFSKPVIEITKNMKELEKSPKIGKYYQNNNVSLFQTNFRVRDPSFKKGMNEFKYVSRITRFFKIPETFPSTRTRIKITEEKLIEFDPLRNALKDIEDKMVEIYDEIISHLVDSKPDTNHLSMVLNGTIDAAVNGGISLYIDAFFTEEYILSHPENIEIIIRFQEILRKQSSILTEGLKLRREHVSGNALLLSSHLENLNSKLVRNEKFLKVLNEDYKSILKKNVGQKNVKSAEIKTQEIKKEEEKKN